ncbi:hypothetical protein CKO51_08510 [Rhodopirellula sp. SM50]|nr:hypothetical protein [Rhodopirellula sp. SM50]PAY19981.1 hypothetical protein CKO51_08510 [Rhodopirellula sp. SM50]
MVANRFPLTLEGLLEFEVQGRSFSVTAGPESIVVDFPDVHALLCVIRSTGPGVSLHTQIKRAGQWLVQTENRLDLRIDGAPIGWLGFGVPSGLGTLLGVGHCRIAMLPLLRSML